MTADNPQAPPLLSEEATGVPPSRGADQPWPKPRLSRVDSPAHTIFGLVVIWISLWLVFTANRWSEVYLRTTPPESVAETDHTLMMSLEPRVKILQPIELHFPRMSAALALQTIGSYVRLNVNPAQLRLLEDSGERSLAYKGQPLYQVIHDLLGSDQLGFALRNNDLEIFPQQLTMSGGEPIRDLRWKTQLDLSPQRLLIFPSGHSPLWLSLRLSGSVDHEPLKWETVGVEIWRRGELVTSAQAPLDAQGHAILSLDTTEKITLKVERQSGSHAERPSRFGIDFHYESF